MLAVLIIILLVLLLTGGFGFSRRSQHRTYRPIYRRSPRAWRPIGARAIRHDSSDPLANAGEGGPQTSCDQETHVATSRADARARRDIHPERRDTSWLRTRSMCI